MFITTLILCLYIIVYVSSLLGHKKKKKKRKDTGVFLYGVWDKTTFSLLSPLVVSMQVIEFGLHKAVRVIQLLLSSNLASSS